MIMEDIVNKYSLYIYGAIKNMSKGMLDNEDIEELVTDTFFVLWKNKDKFIPEKDIKPYLIGIAKNLTREGLRKKKYNENIEDFQNELSDKITIENMYENNEIIKEIEKILKNMSIEDNKIFKMYYFNGMKVKEIAKKLNITDVKVKTKLYRIRNKIKENLRRGGYGNE